MCFTSNFWTLFVVGLATGSVYALIALGYTLVYGVLQLINFAHSEVFMSGAFGGLFFVRAFGSHPHNSVGASVGLLVGGIVAGGVTGAVVALLLERIAYRPLRRRGAPKLAFLISAIGASLFLVNIAGKELGRQPVAVPQIYSIHDEFHVFGAAVQNRQIITFVSAVVMLVLLDRLVAATRLGQGIRAVAQDAETASLMGVNINRIIALTFVIGGVFGGAAGFLYGSLFNASFNMGFQPGVKAFTAAVLGGIGNVRGAMLGGLALGVVESLSITCIGSEWKDVMAFLILVIVLLFRPSGILGEKLGRSA